MAIYEWLTIDDVKKSMSPFLHFNLAIKRPATTINRSEKTPERVRCRFLRRGFDVGFNDDRSKEIREFLVEYIKE